MEEARTLRVSPAASSELPSHVWKWDVDYLYSWQWAFNNKLSIRAVACIRWRLGQAPETLYFQLHLGMFLTDDLSVDWWKTQPQD